MRTLPFTLSLLLIASAASGQPARPMVDYTVKVADIDGQLFHVITDIRQINQPTLNLSLPTWTPGWYTIENYAKNILRFHVADRTGQRLQPQMVHKQTWRIDTTGISELKVEFDYQAMLLALNQATINPEFAFFTGTQLFLQAGGYRDIPSTVRFELPAGWRVATALQDTSDPMVFTAPDYDTLVDQPSVMGRFDVTRFMVDGKPHYLVANPAGVFSKEKTEKLTEYLTKVATVEREIFSGLPYDKYW